MDEVQDAMKHETAIQKWGWDISPKPERRSQSIGKLIEALAKAQLKFEPAKKDSNNPFYKSKYADLGTVIAATQPALAANGLVVIQEPIREGNQAGVVTTLAHSSGEWKESTLLLPAFQLVNEKDQFGKFTGKVIERLDAQTVGIAITYARRYSYKATVGVAEEDDDGNSIAHVQHAEEAYEQRGAPGRIKQFQVNAFLDACASNGKTEKQIVDWLKTLGKVQAEELTPEEFQKGLKWAHGKEALAETLKNSVKAAKKAKEPEGIPLAWEKKTEITDEDVPF